jgi:hypothetical protein
MLLEDGSGRFHNVNGALGQHKIPPNEHLKHSARTDESHKIDS